MQAKEERCGSLMKQQRRVRHPSLRGPARGPVINRILVVAFLKHPSRGKRGGVMCAPGSDITSGLVSFEHENVAWV